jgi:hypothetical protein
MKKHIRFITPVYLFVTIAGILASCSKDDDPHLNWGNASVKLDGQTWIGTNEKLRIYGVNGYETSTHLCNDTTFVVTIQKYNANDFLRQQINLNRIPRKVGTYLLNGRVVSCEEDTKPFAFFSIHSEDGDVLDDVYLALPSAENIITVTAFNSSKGEVRGKFQVTFKIEVRNSSPASLPDTFLIEGEFYTKLIVGN